MCARGPVASFGATLGEEWLALATGNGSVVPVDNVRNASLDKIEVALPGVWTP